MNVLLDAENVTKSFSGALALSNGQLEVREGEIHALMGANGAGKSTLLKILTGVYSKDSGDIRFANEDGQLVEVQLHGPRDADDLGIAIVHQELILSDNLTVADNISLGAEPMSRGGLVIDRAEASRIAADALQQVGVSIDPNARVANLSTAQKQLVEIAKSLSRNARLLILDEPTTSLTDNESKQLFTVLEGLRANGIGIVYVSHRMEEIFTICDRITVMRDGAFVETFATKDTDRDTLIESMIGRRLASEYAERIEADSHSSGEPALQVRNLSTTEILRDVNLSVEKGEIVGLFGLVGAGRTELAKAVFGLDRLSEGTVEVDGRPLRRPSPQLAIKAGIGLVPEDRKDCGLILDLSINDNLDLAAQRRWPFIQWSGARSKELWRTFSQRIGIVARNRNQPVGTLSGGNQQKVVLSKWLALQPTVLILDEPTKGVDVGAKEDIYQVIRELAEAGTGVLVISSEIEEILMISHRVVVMREGAVTLDTINNNLDSHALLSAAMGEAAA